MRNKERLTVTVDSELIEAANTAVEEGRVTSLSGWVNIALAERGRKGTPSAFTRRGRLRLRGRVRQDHRCRDHCAGTQGPPPYGCRSTSTASKEIMTLVLDSGALIALARNDRAMWSA